MWQITPQIRKEIDALTLSPLERYKLVFALIKELHKDLSDYDIAAFCVNFLNQYANNVDPELAEESLELASKFNLIHYTRCKISGPFLSELMKQDKDLENISVSRKASSPS